MIVIASGRDAVGHAAVNRQRNSQIESQAWSDASEQVEPVPCIVIGPGPLTGQVPIVRGKTVDGPRSAGIVVGPGQQVLRHAAEVSGNVAAEGNLEGMSRQIGRRFNLPDLTVCDVWPVEIQ